MPTIEIDTTVQTAVRFPVWIILTACSAVCLVSVDAELKGRDKESDEKWVLAVTIISMCLSFFAVVSYLIVRGLFVGQAPEAAMIALLLGFWAAGLPVIMNPANSLAVSEDVVTNANLYFFSWGSLAAVLFLVASISQETHGINVRDTAPKKAQYIGLCASSVVVMATSIRLLSSTGCEGETAEFCKRTKFAISVGVLSTIGAASLFYFVGKGLDTFFELLATALLLIFWCFAVGFITFGDSPGNKIGNLYFSTWISFILALSLFGSCVGEYLSKRAAAFADQTGNAEPGDVEATSSPSEAQEHHAQDFATEDI